MTSLVLIGNAPSSGSTLLATLLDGTSTSACGPELHLFSSRRFFEFDRARVLEPSAGPDVYASRSVLSVKNLSAYGLNLEGLRKQIDGAEDLAGFLGAFTRHYLGFRSKHPQGVVFEKTPQNIGAIGSFLSTVPNAHFVDLVRDPLYVYRSMRARGFSRYIALASWLVTVAAYLPFENDERVTLLRYEDLIEDPFRLVANLITRVGSAPCDSEAVRNGFEACSEISPRRERLPTWTVGHEQRVENANVGPVPKEYIEDFGSALEMRVNPVYAIRFGLAPISFQDAVKAMGYRGRLQTQTSSTGRRARIRPTIADHIFLGRKALGAMMRGDAAPAKCLAGLAPIVGP